MISFECWIGTQNLRHREDFKQGARAAWDFLTKQKDLTKRFKPEKLLKNIPEYGTLDDDLEFIIKEIV